MKRTEIIWVSKNLSFITEMDFIFSEVEIISEYWILQVESNYKSKKKNYCKEGRHLMLSW